MRPTLLAICIIFSGLLGAQNLEQTVATYLQANYLKYNLALSDVQSIKISSSSYSESMNLTNVYVSQLYNGKEIVGTTSSIGIRSGNVVHAAMSFQGNINARIQGNVPAVDPVAAITTAAAALGLPIDGTLVPVTQQEVDLMYFSNESLSQQDIPVTLKYLEIEQGLVLSYEIGIYTPDGAHYYETYIDATSNTFLKQNDLVLNCVFENDHTAHSKTHKHTYSFEKEARKQTTTALVDNAQYRVFALPAESPNHANGNSTLVINPANPVASPFGWHDTDGVIGPEFTITRGNNVYAQDDLDGLGSTFGTAPDGGGFLVFDFPQQLAIPALQNLPGATVNLFYMNNIMHDVWYLYGFNEQSGNFQSNNYSNGGIGNDFVIADVQDGSGLNNASFFPPIEGNNGRMNMFLWDGDQSTAINTLTVTNGPLAGSYNGVPAGFGNELPDPATPLSGTLVLAVDNNNGGVSIDVNDACDLITNATDIAGKIAVINRGSCEFGFKVLAAQDAGAIAVIVVNNQGTAPISMGPGAVGSAVSIPSIMVNQTTGNLLIAGLQAGNTINVLLNNDGVIKKDSSLDNGVVAHEYGHGISVRLTGGAFNSSCLSNDDQMGEGWSDWFAMIITIEPGDTGGDRRGIGTYLTNQTTTGRGIRNFPYSTNRSINPITYASTNSTQFSRPHGVGSVWGTMLWDLTWRFIEDYGFDPDIYNGTGGNNIVMQLVIDGMKLQPCSPGFVDARDAILQADQLANNGVNRDRIWEVFAARGLGLSATQGDTDDRFDQTEAFDVPTPLSTTDVFNNAIAIYPNPSTGVLTLSSSIALNHATIQVIELNGRVLIEQKEENMSIKKLDLSFLSNGLYIIRLQSDEGELSSKIIIEN